MHWQLSNDINLENLSFSYQLFHVILMFVLTNVMIFRATTPVKIGKQNKDIIIFGQKSARLREVIYLQPGLGGWPLLLEKYSKTSI